jgi:hypothetical protein
LVAAALSFHPPTPPYYKFVPFTATTSTTAIPILSAAAELTSNSESNSAIAENNNNTEQNQPAAPPTFRQSIHFSSELHNVDDLNQPEAYLIPCLKQKDSNIAITIYSRPKPCFVLLYSHGNATDLGAMHHVLASLSTVCNFTVVCYDYNGYGGSTSTPSEEGTYDNIYTVYTFLKKNKVITFPEQDLICYGESIGSGPAIWLCSRLKCAGLILHCPITSGLRVVTDNRLLCCCDIFPNIKRIQDIKCSTFILHGNVMCCVVSQCFQQQKPSTMDMLLMNVVGHVFFLPLVCITIGIEDQQVGVKHGEQLHKKLPGQFAFMPWWVEGAGHNDVRQVSGDTYVYKLRSFIHYLKGAKDGNGENNTGCSTIDRNNGNGKKSSMDPENDTCMHVATVGAEKNDGARGREKDTGDAIQVQGFRVVMPVGKKKTSSMVHPEIVVQSMCP